MTHSSNEEEKHAVASRNIRSGSYKRCVLAMITVVLALKISATDGISTLAALVMILTSFSMTFLLIIDNVFDWKYTIRIWMVDKFISHPKWRKRLKSYLSTYIFSIGSCVLLSLYTCAFIVTQSNTIMMLIVFDVALFAWLLHYLENKPKSSERQQHTSSSIGNIYHFEIVAIAINVAVLSAFYATMKFVFMDEEIAVQAWVSRDAFDIAGEYRHSVDFVEIIGYVIVLFESVISAVATDIGVIGMAIGSLILVSDAVVPFFVVSVAMVTLFRYDLRYIFSIGHLREVKRKFDDGNG